MNYLFTTFTDPNKTQNNQMNTKCYFDAIINENGGGW